MSWTKSTTTKHDCGGPVFGRRTPGCPRCDELDAGAAPVVQVRRPTQAQLDAERSAAWRAHFRGETHRSGGCGPVCTFGDW